MKKILVLVLPLFLAAMSVRADVIWQELFQYTNGPINYNSTNVVDGVMITNWIRYSGSGNDMLVNNNQLEVSSTSSPPAPSRTDDCGRPFANAPGSPYTNAQQVIYVSFLADFTNPPIKGTTYFAHFKYGAYTSTSYEGKIFASLGSVTNTVRLGVSATANAPSATSTIDLALNTQYQVVVEWDPVNLYALSLWVNPISSSDPVIISNDSFSPTAANVANIMCFRQAGTFGAFLTVSNLVVATTFDEAANNVVAPVAVPPTIVYQPTDVTTNFQGDVVNLTTVANGQGQGNLNYQWQVSTDPGNSNPVNVSNPNGNSNILGVDTSTLGTRYYTLVVTTPAPYGLSTTSSIAKVAIIAPTGPPSFIVQPVSQLAYSGQTVTLTTTVLSPVTPTYTWYSNNVVVTTGQQDSGYSSSYVLNNVDPGSSATYRVAVTNSTSAIGIVSTNAVLTVQNPSAVSIAYLRSLADPNNGYSASPTIPYEVTGTITTLTNLTFGDTASYYLQDGTAGINIFATYGSTFRPAQGAVVTFVGVLSSYTTGLELYADLNPSGSAYPYTSATDTGTTAPLPAPISIGFDIASDPDNANFNVAGSLVTLHDVYFGTNAGLVLSTTANNTVTVTNSSGQEFNLFFSYLDQDTAGQTLPTYAYSVSGPLAGINTSFTVDVTRFADIVTTPPPAPIPLTTVYSGGNLTFNWSDPSFNLQTSTNVAGPYSSIPGATSGFMTNVLSSPAAFYRLYHP